MKAFFIFSAQQNRHRVQTVLDHWRSSGHQSVDNLSNSTVAIVLLDTHTSEDDSVRQMILDAYKKNLGMFAIHIHRIPDEKGKENQIGNNRFGELEKDVFFWQHYPTYRWVIDNGVRNLSDWVEKAHQKASSGKLNLLWLPLAFESLFSLL